MQEFWVFGYGSLMWRPGFPYVKCVPAHVYGAHRSLCVYSYVHRGTSQRPGLVLGLDRGGSCRGTAYQVATENVDETIAYLRDREQVTMVYHEVIRPILLQGGENRIVPALFYIVDREHEQYAGRLSLEKQAEFVRQGVGKSGPNPEYLHNTVEHFIEVGLHDRHLEKLDLMVNGANNRVGKFKS